MASSHCHCPHCFSSAPFVNPLSPCPRVNFLGNKTSIRSILCFTSSSGSQSFPEVQLISRAFRPPLFQSQMPLPPSCIPSSRTAGFPLGVPCALKLFVPGDYSAGLTPGIPTWKTHQDSIKFSKNATPLGNFSSHSSPPSLCFSIALLPPGLCTQCYPVYCTQCYYSGVARDMLPRSGRSGS